MAKNNGTKIKILVGGTTLSNVHACTLNTSRGEIDVTNKDSNAWTEFLPGLKTASGTAEFFVDYAASGYKPQTLYTDLTSGNLIAIIFYDVTVGEQSYSFSGYLTKVDFTAGTEDAEKCSIAFKATGAVTQTATT